MTSTETTNGKWLIIWEQDTPSGLRSINQIILSERSSILALSAFLANNSNGIFSPETADFLKMIDVSRNISPYATFHVPIKHLLQIKFSREDQETRAFILDTLINIWHGRFRAAISNAIEMKLAIEDLRHEKFFDAKDYAMARSRMNSIENIIGSIRGLKKPEEKRRLDESEPYGSGPEVF